MSYRKTDTTMTDPVDTDALRGKAKVLWKRGGILRGFGDESDLQDADIDQDVSCMLRATADEVDRLRAELAEGMDLTKQYAKDSARGKRLLERDVHHLRAVIQNAPHADWCPQERDRRDGTGTLRRCACWKADAL